MTPKEEKLNALQYELSRRFEAARVAQNALMAEQKRQGLPATREFYTADEMTAERIASRIELREIVAAAIADCRYQFDPSYKPDAMHQALIKLGRSFAEEAKRPKATDNVVPMTARSIIEAGKRRRGES